MRLIGFLTERSDGWEQTKSLNIKIKCIYQIYVPEEDNTRPSCENYASCMGGLNPTRVKNVQLQDRESCTVNGNRELFSLRSNEAK